MYSSDLGQIVGRSLIDVVIEPVGIEELGGGAPAHQRGLGGIVVGEVVVGDVDVDALVHIPEVLVGQGVGVVLGVAGDEEAAVVLALHGKDPRLLGDGQQLQLGDRQHVLQLVLGVPGVGDIEHIVKAPEQGGALAHHGVGEDAEELLAQVVLGDLIMVVQTGLGAPADVQGGMDVGLGPLHDLAQLIPVVHVGEVQVFYGGAGDDHAVVLLVFDLVKGSIEGGQVAGVGILRDVAKGMQQLHLDLKRRVGQLAQQLGLGNDLGGHQIQNQQIQGTDVLVHGPELRHNEDVFPLQSSSSGERIGDFNGHGKDLPYI